jgi:hypothetical protein
MKGNYILIAIFFALSLKAQITKYANYVNNPSFEIALPSATINAFDAAKYWSSLDSTHQSSHVLRAKFLGKVPNGFGGYQYPKSGDNFIVSSFYCDPSTCNSGVPTRWYPRNRLKMSLKIGKNYCAKYHVVNTNNCVVGIDGYEVLCGGSWMDTTKYCGVPLTYLNPQVQWQGSIISDTLNWIPITGTFVATGAEKYMVLGNFKSDANTQTMVINPTYLPALGTDVLIDDVSLIEMDLPAFAGRDTSVIPGDSIYLGYEQDIEINESCIWYKWPNMTTSIDTIAGFWLKPVSNGTFVVRQQLWCSGVKWDTVVVYMNPLGLNEKLNPDSYRDINEELRIYPIPASNFFEVSIQNQYLVRDFKKLRIYNSLGEMIREEEISFENGKVEIKTNELPEGIYFLRLTSNSSGTVSKRFVIER